MPRRTSTRSRTARLYVGTSGFSYRAWRGPFYPEKTRAADMLAYYATRFRSVEINATFRRVPTPATLSTWRDATPAGFVFALKAPMRITHVLRLKDAATATKTFVDAVSVLGDRTGPILFGCPPNLPLDRERLEAFLAALPREHRYACEFRHPSWEDARALLAEHGVAWCVADDDDARVAPATADALDAGSFAYVRLRRSDYTQRDLGAWAKRLRACVAAGRDVYCYLKHEESATGPAWAERIQELVGS
jgi:uncharacterized protein YecE (DUF72 family)